MDLTREGAFASILVVAVIMLITSPPVINPAGEHTIAAVPEANAVTLNRL